MNEWTSEAQWKSEVTTAMLLRVYFRTETQARHQGVRRLVPGQHQWLSPGVALLKNTWIRETMQNTALLSLCPSPPRNTHKHTSNLRMDRTFILFFCLIMLPKEIWSFFKDKNWSLGHYILILNQSISRCRPREHPLFHYLSLRVRRGFFILLKSLQKPPLHAI